ncbi:MAG: HAD family hydrolase [Clostridia bacterium]|nr:HAD family hydrolase [Clostridia bacterium]NLF20597.1 HAD family hydrolase [Clostridiaceae bacterium]
MFRQWIPDAYYQSLAQVPIQDLFRRGYRVALLDIDNTLAAHGSSFGQDYAHAQVDRFQAAGFQVYILSNAFQHRAESFGQDFGVTIIGDAGKPGTKGVERALQESGARREELLLFGDQLFTDVWSGTRAGIMTVLLDRLSTHEPWYIHLKRIGERFVKYATKTRAHFDRIPEVSSEIDEKKVNL